MPRQQTPAAYPAFSLFDHLQVLFLSLCPTFICVGPRTTSPPASPRTSAELDALLEPVDDNDRADAVSLHSQYGRGRGRRKTNKKGKAMTLGGYSLFGRRQRQEHLESDSDEGEATSAFAVTQDRRDDGDARTLTSSTLDHLPELAQKWEPTVTLEDLQREEARLEEMEREAERAGGLDVYSPPVRQGSIQDAALEDDFGDFEGGSIREHTHHVASSKTASFDIDRSDDSEDNELLNVPQSPATDGAIPAINGNAVPKGERHLPADSHRLSEPSTSPKSGSGHLSVTASSDVGSVGSSGSVGGNPLPRPQRK